MPTEPEIRWWNNLSLQDIVDLAPPNTKLCDIILEIYFPRYLEYVDITFSEHKRNLDAEEFAYKKALKKYEKDFAEYQKQVVEYEEKLEDYNKWAKEEELKNLEKQIKELKKSK